MSLLCSVCDKTFSTQSNLNKHSRKVHKRQPKVVSYDRSRWNNKCLESGCNRSFHHNIDLIDHLSENHHINMQFETMTFSNKEDFLAWKHLIEKKDKSNYIILRTHRMNGKMVTYYTCNRSGKKISFSNNVRLPKPQGSCKLNRYCTSSIKVIHGKNLLVTWNRTHYGHSFDLQHIRIPKIERSVVASKLTLGVPPSRILDCYRNKNGENINREDLITRKDIQNIKNSYGINTLEGIKHESDDISVELWLEQCEQEKNNPLLLYEKEILMRHKTACSSKFSVEFDSENQAKWYINTISSNKDHELYCVEKLFDGSCCDLECRECKICLHTYSCTCKDFCVSNKICKHIHCIEMTYYPRTEEMLQSNECDDEIEISTEDVDKSDILRKSFFDKVIKTMTKLQNADKYKLTDEVIVQIESHLASVEKLLELPPTSDKSFSLTQTSDNEPQNKKSDKHQRFLPTQVERDNGKNISSELSDINEDLERNFTELYVSRNPTEDHNYLSGGN